MRLEESLLNEDLFDIRRNYFDRGDMFWLAIDENDRVVGSIGYSKTGNKTEAFLHRLFVKAEYKHKGIGTALLLMAEEYMKNNGITVSKVHLGTPKEEWFEDNRRSYCQTDTYRRGSILPYGC